MGLPRRLWCVSWEVVELDDAQPVGLVDEGGPRRAAGLCHDGEVGVAEESEHVVEDAVIEQGRDVALDDAAAVGDEDKEDTHRLDEPLFGKDERARMTLGKAVMENDASRSVRTSARRQAMSEAMSSSPMKAMNCARRTSLHSLEKVASPKSALWKATECASTAPSVPMRRRCRWSGRAAPTGEAGRL